MKTYKVFLFASIIAIAFIMTQQAKVSEELAKKGKVELERIAYSLIRHDLETNKPGANRVDIQAIKDLSTDKIITTIENHLAIFKDFDDLTKLNELVAKYTFTNNISIEDALKSNNRFLLEQMALKCEEYDRKKKNVFLLGGLHDYIASLDDAKVIEYINNAFKENPELKVDNKLMTILEDDFYAIPYKLDNSFIFFDKFDFEKLKQAALAAERYYREQSGLFLIGGLHDYIDRLSKSEIINEIANFAKDYKELKSEQFIENLINKFKDDNDFAKVFKEELVKDNKTVQTLFVEIAKKYLKDKLVILGNKFLARGDDSLNKKLENIDRLSVRELKSILDTYNKKLLNSGSNPFRIVSKATVIPFSLAQHLATVSIEDLKSICFSLESYERKNKPDIIGGLHDYVHSLSRQDLIDYAVARIEKFPELASVKAITDLVAAEKAK